MGEFTNQSAVVHVAVPFGVAPDELKIEDSSKDAGIRVGIKWLYNNREGAPSARWSEEEVALIILSTAALFVSDAGTIGECLDTAIVWSRG